MKMTREQRNAKALAYLRKRRARKTERCLCGRLATLLKWGDHVCQRCFDWEKDRDRAESRREHRKKRGVDGGLEEYRCNL